MDERTTPGGSIAPGLCPVCRVEPTPRGAACCAQCTSADHSRPRCPRCHQVVAAVGAKTCKACKLTRPSDGWPRPPFAFEAGYTVLAELARDPLRVVYLAARDFDASEPDSRELVALKVATDDAEKDRMYEAFRAESFKLGRLGNQPDIVQVKGVERTRHKAPYIVTELAGGVVLSRVIERSGGGLAVGSAAWLGWKIAEALHKVHEQRLVHLGLSPSHLFVLDWGSSREAVKLAGFGGSLELHGPGSVSLSVPLSEKPFVDPRFMAPEQALLFERSRDAKEDDVEIDPRADIYGLGALLHVMLTGGSPFEPEPKDESAWIKAHRQQAPVDPCEKRPEVPRALCDVVLRCLSKGPEERYQSAAEVAEALKDVLLLEVLPGARQRAAGAVVPRPTSAATSMAKGDDDDCRDVEDRTLEAEQRVEALEEEVQQLQGELDKATDRLKQAVSARQRAEARVAAEQAKVDHPSGPVVVRLSQKLLSRVTARFVRVLPGTFTMGSPLSEAGRLERRIDVGSDPYATEPSKINFELQHEVTISRPFLLQTTPVTQAQFEALMGFNPSDFKDPRFPVESVSWFDAVAFCNRLSEQQGIPESQWAYELRDIKGKPGDYGYEAMVKWNGLDRLGFRLPTEAEWEYACRAGTVTATYTGDLDPERVKDEQPNPTLDPIAWFGGNSGNTTQKVATKAPNEWGLSDMLGNVWEWVWDWDDMYPSDPISDPSGSRTGDNRVIRGGSWSLYARFCRAAYRGRDWPGHRFNDIGFRPCRTLP